MMVTLLPVPWCEQTRKHYLLAQPWPDHRVDFAAIYSRGSSKPLHYEESGAAPSVIRRVCNGLEEGSARGRTEDGR